MTKLLTKMTQKNKAFTLFVALIVSALVLAIGLSIGNIILKQLILSSSNSGSTIAFYAADSAAECALFWDRKDADGNSISQSPFGTTTIPDLRLVCGTGSDIDGAGLIYGFKKECEDGSCGPSALEATSTFYIDFRDPLDDQYTGCAFVTVAKKFNPDTGIEDTVIQTRGYNTNLVISSGGGGYTYDYTNPDVRCNLSKQRIVERGLILDY